MYTGTIIQIIVLCYCMGQNSFIYANQPGIDLRNVRTIMLFNGP